MDENIYTTLIEYVLSIERQLSGLIKTLRH